LSKPFVFRANKIFAVHPEDEFGLRVVKALGFTATNKNARIHWMLDPEAGAVVREDAQRSLAKVLAHRLWTDLRRGWRYTNPSLSVLKLIDVAFIELDDIAEDTERLTAILPDFGTLDAPARTAMPKLLLGARLDGLAVGTEALDLTVLDAVAQKSRNLLRVPWAIDTKETPRSRTTLFLQAPGKGRVGLREEQTIVRVGHNSRIGRLINRKSVIGTKLGKTDYLTVMTGLMELLAREGLVSRVDMEADLQGCPSSVIQASDTFCNTDVIARTSPSLRVTMHCSVPSYHTALPAKDFVRRDRDQAGSRD
jgi:hypothetical protein